MASRREQEKTISFHRLWIETPNGRAAAGDIDWRPLLQAWSKRPFPEQGVQGTYFLPDLTRSLPALGIHREVADSFQSLLNKEKATAVDLLDGADDDEDSIRANSTAVVFLPKKSIIACALGNVSSPRPSTLTDFLSIAKPTDPETHWLVEPLVDRGKIAQFRDESDGIYKAEIKMSTMRDLFTAEQEAGGLGAALDAVAYEIGSELDFDITIALKDSGKQSQTARRKFKNFLTSSGLHRVASASKARVYTASEDGSDSGVLDLLEHRFTLKETVQTDALASKTFTALMDTTSSAAAKVENKLYALVQ